MTLNFKTQIWLKPGKSADFEAKEVYDCPGKLHVAYYAPFEEEGVHCFAPVSLSVNPSVVYNLVQSITRVWLGPAFSNFIQTLVIESSLLILGSI